jgi:hypothetical protein
VLAIVAVLLVVVAVALGTGTFLVWRDATETRDATKPLEARVAQLQTDLTSANTVIDRYTELFAAITAQTDATAKAVDAANQAAQQYNTAQADSVAGAFGARIGDTATALAQSTTAVQTAVDRATEVLADLARATTDGTHG